MLGMIFALTIVATVTLALTAFAVSVMHWLLGRGLSLDLDSSLNRRDRVAH